MSTKKPTIKDAQIGMLATGGIIIMFLFTGEFNFRALVVVSIPFIISILIFVRSSMNETNSYKVISFFNNVGLFPKPTEAYMYVLSLSILLVGLINYKNIFYSPIAVITLISPIVLIIFLMSLVGAGYSIFFAFSKKIPSGIQLQMIRFFLVISLAGVSIGTFVAALKIQYAWASILAVWNLVQAAILIIFSGEREAGDNINFIERQANGKELIISTLIILLVVGFGKFVFLTEWSIVVSTTIIIWTLLENWLHKLPANQTSPVN